MPHVDLRTAAEQIFRSGLAAADPHRLLAERSRWESDRWIYRGPDGELTWGLPDAGSSGRIRVVGGGKAAAHLARALEEGLGPRIAAGRIVVKYGHGLPLERIRVDEGAHPLPDRSGFEATRRLLSEMTGLGADDVVICLLTGGGSALLVAPAEGVALEDKTATTRLLLSSGASIQEMNAVRKHLSAVKGGRLLERLAPARVLTLIVSDVVGDDLSSIASGPTAPDPTTFRAALEVLERYRLADAVPRAVSEHLARGAEGRIGETPKPGDPLFDRVRHVILASNRQSVDAACARARELGFEPEVFAYDMVGSTHEKARAFAARLLARAPETARRTALVAGGETTLEVRGSGTGGRNQEFALVAAGELRGAHGALVLSAGTDGTDGPTDAAGAFADGSSIERAVSLGLDPDALLRNNDSHSFFAPLGDLFHTGPTGTNVMDLVIGLADPHLPKA